MAQRAYVLHRRPYQDDAALAELLLDNDSRAGAVVRGLGARKTDKRAAMQPFVCLELTLAGKGELRSARQIEVQRHWPLAGNALYAGFYLNEILIRLLARDTEAEGLFSLYEQTLAALTVDAVEPVLRRFELSLMSRLGYGIDLWRDAGGAPLAEGSRYQLVADAGLVARLDGPFLGAELLALAQGHWQQANALKTAKVLCRMLLSPHLGDKPLKSRELFKLAGGKP